MSAYNGEEIGFIKLKGVSRRYIFTRPNVRLRLLTIKSSSDTPSGRVLFVPGWMSFSDTWRLVIRELLSKFDIYYLETREKNSSEVDRDSSFGIDELAHDYKVVADDICGDGLELFVVCSSIGAATVIRGFSQGVRPAALAMISPILRPEIPRITRYLTFLFGGPLGFIGRALISWWYGLFVYRVSKDQFQYSRFLQVLENCDPWKMTRGARDLTGLRIELDEVGKLDIPVGTMIEIPRAALTADEVARHADFFSFGTNDLTQMTFGFSRDDVNTFLPAYLESELLERDPFQSLDVTGVGQLVEMGVRKGRATSGDLKIGICGEHGGDPASITFCHRIGLDYVSCSPYRVPIARLAAAQAAVLNPGG